MHRNKRSIGIASRTTGVENTYQALTAIPCQVEVNNSLKRCVFTSEREKICGISVLVYLRFLVPTYNCEKQSFTQI